MAQGSQERLGFRQLQKKRTAILHLLDVPNFPKSKNKTTSPSWGAYWLGCCREVGTMASQKLVRRRFSKGNRTQADKNRGNCRGYRLRYSWILAC